MTPQPVHPDDIKPLGGGIRQRFTESRFGWYVHTTHNCFHVEVVPFAFTRTGIERKARRIVRSITHCPTTTFERVYDERGRSVPSPLSAPDGLGRWERSPR